MDLTQGDTSKQSKKLNISDLCTGDILKEILWNIYTLYLFYFMNYQIYEFYLNKYLIV